MKKYKAWFKLESTGADIIISGPEPLEEAVRFLTGKGLKFVRKNW